MYHSPTSFEPLLAPEMFCTEQGWEQERRAVFDSSWYLVSTAQELEKTGAFVTLELLGVPIVIRNFGDQLVALRNVCAHRQCKLVAEARGQSERLKCPFHGWEYGADGRTRRLPGVSNFPHFNNKKYCLTQFPLEQCGDLIFIRLTQEGESLREFLGERFDMFAKWFVAPDWKQTMFRRFEYPANWKIPVEAGLESYHIPSVHPGTFAEDPGESQSTHEFFDTGSSLQTEFLTPRWIDRLLKKAEQLAMWIMGIRFHGGYQHHHVFPNLLISHTESLSLAQIVIPTGPKTSYGLVWQYGRQAKRSGMLPRWWAWGWGIFATMLTTTILKEDIGIYAHVQAGVEGASGAGLLGRCEERLYALQKFVRERIDAVSGTEPSSTSEGPAISDMNQTDPTEEKTLKS